MRKNTRSEVKALTYIVVEELRQDVKATVKKSSNDLKKGTSSTERTECL